MGKVLVRLRYAIPQSLPGGLAQSHIAPLGECGTQRASLSFLNSNRSVRALRLSEGAGVVAGDGGRQDSLSVKVLIFSRVE